MLFRHVRILANYLVSYFYIFLDILNLEHSLLVVCKFMFRSHISYFDIFPRIYINLN